MQFRGALGRAASLAIADREPPTTMTFRTPRAAPHRKRSSSMGREQRQQLLVTFGFIGAIVVAIVILVGAVGAMYYGDHLAAIATVNGVSISKDDWHNQQLVDEYRINTILASLQGQVSSGAVDQSTAQQEAQYLQQEMQSLPQTAASELIDGILQSQLAKQEGVSVSQADVDNELKQEATSPEQRKVLAIFVAPGATPAAQATPAPSPSASAGAGASPSPSGSASASPSSSASASTAPAASTAGSSAAPSTSPAPSASTGPTPAQDAAAKAAADAALAAIKAGTPWATVAKQYSTDPSATKGGDYGYITSTNTVDQAWVNDLFKLPLNGMTGVVKGADGVYRIGKVTDIVAPKTDPNFQKNIEAAGVNYAAYRQAVYYNLVSQKLQDAITKKATTGNIEQVHAWEIKIATTDANGNPITGPEVKAAHILISPKGNPNNASSIPASDPSWAAAQKQADALAAQLRAISDPTQRAAEFAKLAKSDSNDTTSGANGGELGWFTQAQMVPAFSGPLFTGTHQVDEIIGPVKSQYGYHVILFEGSRPSPQDRLKQIQKDLAAPGASFSAIAKANSDATDAASGGDMGWVAPYQLDQQTQDVLFSLKVGQVSQPQTKSDGIYLYEVSQKESRKVDSSQLSTLQGSAFTNWYAAQKAKANIWQSPDIAAATPPAS